MLTPERGLCLTLKLDQEPSTNAARQGASQAFGTVKAIPVAGAPRSPRTSWTIAIAKATVSAGITPSKIWFVSTSLGPNAELRDASRPKGAGGVRYVTRGVRLQCHLIVIFMNSRNPGHWVFP